MSRALPVLAMLAVATGSARAGAILYATAASQSHINGFCLNDDGSIVPAPILQQGTSRQPRRLKVVTLPSGRQVLYVAQLDRIDAYSIGDRGFISHIGGTRSLGGMDPRDLWVDPMRMKLYVPQRRFSRIAAYSLDAAGAPIPSGTEGGFDSCIQGQPGAGYLDVWVDNVKSLLYVSADGGSGRIEIHQIGADGGLVDPEGQPVLPDMCKRRGEDGKRPPQTPPLSERRRLQNPKAFIINGDMMYIEERFRKRITSFQLSPQGTFCPLFRTKKDAKNFGEPCDGFQPIKRPKCARRQANKGRRQQCAASQTGSVRQYEALTMLGDTLLGAQFYKGRVDSYRLRPPEGGGAPILLPHGPTRTTSDDPKLTPIGLIAVRLATLRGEPDDGGRGVVYVAAGEFDRVLAYPLDADGVLAGTGAFSSTSEQRGSFPNDVAIAVLPQGCGGS